MTDLSLVVNNNVTVDKAVGVLGGFETSAGQFDASGKVTAYFADIASIAAVQANDSVTIDGIFAHENVGVLFDMPLVGLGDGKLAVAREYPGSRCRSPRGCCGRSVLQLTLCCWSSSVICPQRQCDDSFVWAGS